MIKMLGYKITILLLIVSMLTSVLACGGGGSSTPTSDINPESTSSATSGNLESAQAQQISAIGQSNTEEERKPAIEEVVRQGFTLGLVDENGNQLNPNIPADSLSLTPEDVAAHAVMIPGGNYRTIGYVVDSLAEEGIVLTSTEEVISLEDFLPDLQDYVDWSFDNPDDPKSSLGLLIGSGHELEVPDSAPTIEGETLISPLASLMIMADILLGVEESLPEEANDDIVSEIISFFTDDAYADDEDEKPKDIKGLVTKIKSVMGKLTGFLPSDKWKQSAGKLLATLEFNNRFMVRMVDRHSTDEWGGGSFSGWASIIELNTTHIPELIGALIIVPKQKSGGANFEVVIGMPASFTFALTSPGYQIGLPLYPDADAQLLVAKGFEKNTSQTSDGYRATIESQMKASKATEAFTEVEATKLSSETRTAILLASATIETRLNKLSKNKQFAISYILGMTATEIDALVATVKPAPWICLVKMKSQAGLECGKKYHSDDNKIVWWEGCTLYGENHGKCRYYYEDGDIHSEGTYDNGKKDGFYTTYYSRPAGTVNCEAEYEDDELLWEKCYSIDGQVLSEINADGSGKNYYWSGRVQTECNYTSSGAECRTYCDNEAHTLCGEYELDEYGDDIKMRDDCDTMCSGNPPS